MTSPILLTGGTGTLGRLVMPRLRDAGCDVRVLSRHNHESGDGIEYVTGDLLKGEGIEPAVQRAEIILHLAGGLTQNGVACNHCRSTGSNAGAPCVSPARSVCRPGR